MAEEYVRVLAALAKSGVVGLLVTMRCDYYARAAELAELMALKEGGGRYDLQPPTAERLLVGNQTYYYNGTNYYQPCCGGADTDYCVVSDPNQQGKKVDEFSAVGLKVKRSFFLVLAVAVAAALAGCAAAPPVQPQGPNKPLPWRSIYRVKSDGKVGWYS